MNKRYTLILILFHSVALLFVSTSVVSQTNRITIESIVKDENGNPIKGAVIYGNEGGVIATSDEAGRFSITVPASQTDLYIESDGYESALFEPGNEYTLTSSAARYGSRDDINIAFGRVKKGDLVNAVSVLKSSDILPYDNNLNLSQALAGRVPGLLGTSNIRGLGGALFIVDGLPRDISAITLAEVEEITFLKDINSAMLYGSAARNGVVLIRTKRGEAFKKDVKVTGYYGFSKPTALPNYLSSADYAELHNEARINDGLTPQFDAQRIEDYRTGNPYIYPNIDYYSSEYLRSSRPFFKLMTELSGGNENARYYTNLGWDQTGSLLNFGEGTEARQNVFNIRGNVDMRVNYWITTALDAAFILNSNRGPLGDYWADAAILKPNLIAPLIPISMIDPENSLLAGRKSDINGLYLAGGNQSVLTNPIARSYLGGHNETVQRTFAFNNRIDFDLNELADLEGLAFHTNISFDLYTRYDQSINNGYSVYEATWNPEGTTVIDLERFGEDTRTGSQNIDNPYYERRFGFYGMLDYDRTFEGLHHVSGALLGFATKQKAEGDFQGNKSANLGLRLAYGYNKKYLVDFSSAYVNSVKLPEGNRAAFSPSLGLAWVMSSEDFMSNVSAIDYLKLRVSAGAMNSDLGIGGFYYYDNVYGGSGSYAWYDGTWSNGGVRSLYGGNNRLGFEKRKEINAGFEMVFMDRMLHLDANVFSSVLSGIVTRPQTQYPNFFDHFIPYENFNENLYKGAELGLTFNRNIGAVSVTVGANALYSDSEVRRRDEAYLNAYQNRTGHPVDATFGLEAEGFFTDQADIDNHAVHAFGNVRPGDIKYRDQNNDGIVDQNDEVAIGRLQAPFSYGLNLNLSYRNFTLFALGTGSTGADNYLDGDYYWVDGNDKYSDFVLNRWTEATKTTATYPRLSSQANQNNFRNSTFWLYRENFFNLSRVQLTYSLPQALTRSFKMKHLDFYADASNLFTISKYDHIRDLSIGSEPFYRSYSIGARMIF